MAPKRFAAERSWGLRSNGLPLMTRSLPPEFRLIAACAMWPPSDRRMQAINAALSEPLDWPRALRVARRHQVVGLVHDALTRLRADVPPEIVQEIRTEATTLVRDNLDMAQEALRLQRLFDDANLPVLFIKGAALAILAFGNLGLRYSQDIDLLIPYESLPAATTLIARAGYRRFDPPYDINDAQLRDLLPLRKDIGFIHEVTGVRVELHWRLFLNSHAFAETSIMTASRVIPVTGAAGLRTLGEEDLFAYLCMHGALHWWHRLKWLADVNGLLASKSDRDVELLIRGAEARGAGRAATQALLLCHRLLGTPLPARLTDMRANGVTARWLEKTALKALTTGRGEQDPHFTRFGTTRGSVSTILLGSGWRYKLGELAVQLTNPTDVLTLPLPKRLRFFYPFLRLPFWVWRHTVQHTLRK